MNFKKAFFLLVFLLLIIATYFSFFNEKKKEDTTIYKAKIGLYKGEASFLMILADRLGYLKEENLDIELKYYPSGRDAMKGLLNAEVDYANCTDFVAAKNSFKRKDFKILASMAEASINGMLSKKSSEIQSAKDIKGKKVGTTIGTATEYYTGVFLEQYNMSLDDVQLVHVPRNKRYEVMENDSVDALFAWEPFIYNLKKKYQDTITYHSMPIGFEFYFIFLGNEKFHKENPQISKRILKALLKAEKFAFENKSMLKKHLKEHFNLDDEYLDYSMQKHEFILSFPHTLSTVMENQAQWLKSNNLVKEEKVKDFNSLFDVKVLKELSPSSVTVME